MLRNYKFAGWFVTIYLVVYTGLTQFESTLSIAFAMFIFGPVLMIWLVYCVLKRKDYGIKPLDKNEYGYQDKDTNALGLF